MIESLALIAAGVLLALLFMGLERSGARSSAWEEGFADGMQIGYKQGYAKGQMAGRREALNLPFTEEPELSDEYLQELMGEG